MRENERGRDLFLRRREEEIWVKREEREKEIKKTIKFLQFLSIYFQIWDCIIHPCQIFCHIEHLMWDFFGVPNAKHLTFGTSDTSALEVV